MNNRSSKKTIPGKIPECTLKLLIRKSKIEIETRTLAYDGSLYEETNPPEIVKLLRKCDGVHEVSIEKLTIELQKKEEYAWSDIIPCLTRIIQEYLLAKRFIFLQPEYRN